jgi:hypothetical protein
LSANSKGSYEVFGTATQKVDRPNFVERFQYLRTWSPAAMAAGDFENPPNLDYGSKTPHYDGGSTIDSNGVEIEAPDLAFQIFSDAPAAEQCEGRFSFIEEITGPLYSRSLRDAAARRENGEIAIDDRWTLLYPSPSGDMVTNRVREFQQFLQVAMSVPINLERSEELLGLIARCDFGASAAPHVLQAWRSFSDAIQQYPFSGPVALGVVQKGPAHPLFFSPDYQPRHNSGKQFKNDLSWTQPWARS